MTGRDYPVPTNQSRRYHYLSTGRRNGARRAIPHRTISLADIAVRPDGTELVAVLPDGTRHSVLVVLGEFLHALTSPSFAPWGTPTHTPRIVIDNLVVAREAWPGNAAAPVLARRRQTPLPRSRQSDSRRPADRLCCACRMPRRSGHADQPFAAWSHGPLSPCLRRPMPANATHP